MTQKTLQQSVRTAYAETHIAADVVSNVEVNCAVRPTKFREMLPQIRDRIDELERSLREAMTTVRNIKLELNKK